MFQPFIHPGNVIWTYSFLQITDAGLNWTILLLARLIVSLTAIVLLSSISPMQEVVQSFRKLGMPRDLAMILSIMVRFLFIFYDELRIVREAQKSRNFDIHNKECAVQIPLYRITIYLPFSFFSVLLERLANPLKSIFST